jgi:hypothetical protein
MGPNPKRNKTTLRRISTGDLLDINARLPLERSAAEALVVYVIRLGVYALVIAANLILLGLVLIVVNLPVAVLFLLLVTGILIGFVYRRLKAHLAERPFPIFEVAAGFVLGVLVAVAFATFVPESWQDAIAPARDFARRPPVNATPVVVVLVTEVRESTPTPTFTLVPDTPTPTSTATPTRPLPTDTPTVTATPTLTPTATATQAPPVLPPTATPSVPQGALALLAPRSDAITSGSTSFEWTWSGPLPPDYGFEVRVWREGDIPAGVHDAVLDNREGRVQRVGDNTYRLNVDITDAPGVARRSGIYLWTVVLVRISPDYQDLGTSAEPASFKFESPFGG